MKSKVISLTVSLALIWIISTNVNAQGFFIKFNAGYNFPFDDDDHEIFSMFNYSANHSFSGSIYTYENIRFSLGKGINITLSPGYMFNKYLGAELGISYLFGIKTESYDHNLFLSGSEYNQTNSCKGALVSIIPSLTFSAGFNKIDPYSRFGLIVGIPSFTHESYSEMDNGDIYKNIWKYSGGIALGVSGALGIKYPITKKLGAFIELAMNSLNYSPLKSVLTESSINGTDQLPAMTTSDKEFEYVDQYIEDSSVPDDPDKPFKTLKFTVPFSSLAINLGVSMRF